MELSWYLGSPDRGPGLVCNALFVLCMTSGTMLKAGANAGVGLTLNAEPLAAGWKRWLRVAGRPGEMYRNGTAVEPVGAWPCGCASRLTESQLK